MTENKILREARIFRKGRKGQMFLLGALVIVSILIILRYNIAYPSAVEEKKVLENRFESEMFINMIEEFNNTLRFSYKEPLNITPNIFDFANFTEKKIVEHSIYFKFLFVGSVANKTTNSLNVSVINMLDKKIGANLTLSNLSSSQSDSSEVQNYGVWQPGFSITAGSEYTLNLTYNGFKESIHCFE